VITLAGVLEERRELIKAELGRKDEGALFTLANEFAVRHQRRGQQGDYDPAFLNWMVWWYLGTIEVTNQQDPGSPGRSKRLGKLCSKTASAPLCCRVQHLSDDDLAAQARPTDQSAASRPATCPFRARTPARAPSGPWRGGVLGRIADADIDPIAFLLTEANQAPSS
jgi:hypothetical protein